MRIISADYRKGIVQFHIEDIDDLWYLSQIIEEGDILKGKTTRKIRIGDGDNAKVVKKTYVLAIKAEQIEFGSQGETLRVNGKVQEGHEDVPKESYHSITLEKGSECTVMKEQWLSFQKKRVEDATKKKYTTLLCVFDREDAIFGMTKKFGYEVLTKLKGDVAKKSKDVSIHKDFHKEIIELLENYNTRYNPNAIVLASPAFYKEDLLKKINKEEIKRKIVLATCSNVSSRSFDEILLRPEVAKIMANSRAREEKKVMEELLEQIHKEELAVYGWIDTLKAVEQGAVKTLLLTNHFIKQKKEANEYQEVDECMKKVDSLQGTISILSSDLESGKKLDGLGGIGAILRYRI